MKQTKKNYKKIKEPTKDETRLNPKREAKAGEKKTKKKQ